MQGSCAVDLGHVDVCPIGDERTNSDFVASLDGIG